MFTLVKLVIDILAMFKLIPKSKLVSKHDTLLLEDEMSSLSRINVRQAADLTKLRKDFKDLEKLYQDVFLSEQEAKRLNKTLETHSKELHKAKEEITVERDVANQQYAALQDQATEATELSIKLKEALAKWMS
tara:strand:- start:7649 stop:8047 length:399 start_codon:yes stop_codon:yes gene_type:complete